MVYPHSSGNNFTLRIDLTPSKIVKNLKLLISDIMKYLHTLLLSCLAASSVQADLIAHWPLDTDASDSTGNGHNGTVVDGATLISDKPEPMPIPARRPPFPTMATSMSPSMRLSMARASPSPSGPMPPALGDFPHPSQAATTPLVNAHPRLYPL